LKAWPKSQLPSKWHYGTNLRIPEIVVVADSSWSIGTRPDGIESMAQIAASIEMALWD